MIAGVFLEKLMLANLFLQAVAFCMCAYGLATKRELGLSFLYGGQLLLILAYFAIALIVAAAPIPERGFGWNSTPL